MAASGLAADFLRDIGVDEVDIGIGEDAEEELMDEEAEEAAWTIPDAVEMYIESRRRPRETLANLVRDEKFLELMEQMQSDEVSPDIPAEEAVQLIDEYNETLGQVDQEILALYRHIRDIYGRRFPELESLVVPPVDYVSVVHRLGNDFRNMASKMLSDLVPAGTVMAVTVAASVTMGTLLSPSELQRVMDSAEDVLTLAEHRKRILSYIEKHLWVIAPNLTALTGSASAAQLVIHAGSLKKLADMPAQNILNLGGSSFSRSRTAFSTTHGQQTLPAAARRGGRGHGVIWLAEIVQSAPPRLRTRAVRMLAGKCGLAARSDAYNRQGDVVGRQLRAQIIKTLRKAQELPPPAIKKALPIPDDTPKARRGGRRWRQQKEKYGMSELQQQANRLQFGLEAEGDYGMEDVHASLGMVGVSQIAKLKLRAKETQRLRRPREKIRKGMLTDLI